MKTISYFKNKEGHQVRPQGQKSERIQRKTDEYK